MKFVSLEEFEAIESRARSRKSSGKSAELRAILDNKENYGKPLIVPQHLTKCAKVEEGYTKETTQEKTGFIAHALNAAIESLNRNEHGGKIVKKLKFHDGNAYLLITKQGESQTEISRTMPEASNEDAETNANEAENTGNIR